MPHPRDAWTLDPEVHFLNHGSFGACPRVVLEEQAEWRARIEREPVRFLARELEGHLEAVLARLGAFLGARPEDLGLVPNATTGVNAVLRSLSLAPGDELLITSHGYNACNNAARFVAERSGARVAVAELPFPLTSPDEVVEAIVGAATGRTRLALVDHVTSPTGLVLPMERIVAALAERGIDTLVDGAHAPGMLPLDLEALGAAYYTGNCHKWLCTPKGSAFLWVRRDRQAGVRPTVISHGANSPRTDRSRFQLEFGWPGTVDPTPWLAVPAALDFLGGLLPGGFEELRRANRERVLGGRRLLLEVLGAPEPAPASMIGSLASVPLPPAAPREGAPDPFEVDPVQTRLFDEMRIEVPVFPFPAPPARLLRISAQAYNTDDDYRALARALPHCLAGSRA